AINLLLIIDGIFRYMLRGQHICRPQFSQKVNIQGKIEIMLIYAFQINENCDHVDEQVGLHEDVLMDDGEQDDPNDTLPNMQQLYPGASYTRFSFMVKVGEGTNKSPQKAKEDARWHKLKRKAFDLHAAVICMDELMQQLENVKDYILGTLLGIPGKLMICNMAGCTHVCTPMYMFLKELEKERTPDWLKIFLPYVMRGSECFPKYSEIDLKYPENDLVSEEPVLVSDQPILVSEGHIDLFTEILF
ncbi:hypothetical protein ACJX0J_033803, partial [Zea mays]